MSLTACRVVEELLSSPTRTTVPGTSTAPWRQMQWWRPSTTALSWNVHTLSCSQRIPCSVRTSKTLSVEGGKNQNRHVSRNTHEFSYLILTSKTVNSPHPDIVQKRCSSKKGGDALSPGLCFKTIFSEKCVGDKTIVRLLTEKMFVSKPSVSDIKSQMIFSEQ